MTVNEIRKKFLAFFKSKEHAIIKSDSVVPKDDPTVLFTTAGMQQFKRQFLGHIDDYTRAATSQKCIRTDDLDEVGETDFHHTFFEMLGNFSFGDYFKEEAIIWGWEFLTQELKIPEDRLWVSVYKDDDEAADIWLKTIKIDSKKLFRLGDKSNFWPSNAKENGPNGPCGPCSEIFYDYEPDKKSSPKDPDDEPGRFCEVWNLVFTQYNRKDGGELDPLPSKNIDTGMGLERLASVMQGVQNNFETDIWQPIIKAIEKALPKIDLKSKRVIADHMRAICFGIADGVVPSNEGRGYVIKKLIIDITDRALQLTDKPVIHTLVGSVAEAMDAYPEIAKKEKDIAGFIKSVEKAYIKVRSERLPEFKKKAKKASAQELGELIFVYRDTYGLALNTIAKTLDELKIDSKVLKGGWRKYEERMKAQQDQSRAASNITKNVFTDADLNLDVAKTEFVGYKEAETESKILALIADGKTADKVKEGDQVQVILEQTPFYAESGGQVGDNGYLTTKAGSIRIEDTQKQDDISFHKGVVEKGSFKVKDKVMATITVDRRLSIMRNHTATHMLQYAMRKVLGDHIQQQGSFVGEDRLRFDFTHHQQITDLELKQIEDIVNMLIRACDEVKTDVLPIDEANKLGALSFFAEKYADIVRVVSIGDYSKEFCGGTHLGSTGQIGTFVITQESAIAQGIRRIEARTGIPAMKYIDEREATLEQIAKALKAPVSEVAAKVKQQAKKLKELEAQMAQLRFESIKNSVDVIIDNAKDINGIQFITEIFDDQDMGTLRKVSDILKKKAKSSLIALGSKSDDKASILIAATDAAIKKGFKSNEIIQKIAPIIDGSGGGKPQLAQAGGKNTKNLKKAFDELNQLIAS